MKTAMKFVKIFVALTLLAAMLVGCAKAPATAAPAPAVEDDWSYIQEKGTLVIGITEYAPMNYYDADGKLIGFDTEFAEAVCGMLGVQPEFIVIDWDSKELELSSKNIDCIWNGLTVTEERKANMAFSNSYLYNCQMIVVPADKAAEYTDLSAFTSKTIVAEEGSAGASAITEGIPEATFVGVGAQTDALLEVKAGTADAAVIDKTMAAAMVGEGTDYADLVALDIPMAEEEYAVGFRLDSSAVAKLNEALAKLYADGTMASLAEKYELTSLLIAA